MKKQLEVSSKVINNFKLAKNTEEMVILEVKEKDAWTIAQYPFLSSDYKYITITKGKEHMLTITKENGTTSSFSFGESGHTCVSDNLTMLKFKALDAVFQYGILIDIKTMKKPTQVEIFYNDYFKRWQSRLCVGDVEGEQMHFFNCATEEETIQKLKEIFAFEPMNIIVRKAVTGIMVWSCDMYYDNRIDATVDLKHF